MSKPRERAVKEILPDGKIFLMSKADEKKWRKTIKSSIKARRSRRRNMLTKADRCQEMLGPFQCELGAGHEQRCKFDSPVKRTTAKADKPMIKPITSGFCTKHTPQSGFDEVIECNDCEFILAREKHAD